MCKISDCRFFWKSVYKYFFCNEITTHTEAFINAAIGLLSLNCFPMSLFYT